MKKAMMGLVALTALSSCIGWPSVGEITLADRDVEPPYSAQISQRAPGGPRQTVEITAYITGWVKAPADILIDQEVPNVPPELREAQWVPSLAYSVRHPTRGYVILDTGLRAGACDYGLRPIYWVPCRNQPGQDLVSQLKASEVDPDDIRFIVVSHFHGDHISGLSGLLSFADSAILTTEASLTDVRSWNRAFKGIPADMLSRDMAIQTLDDDMRLTNDGLAYFDVFGDGSLRLFATPGHTQGHLSAIAQGVARDVIFTFDASHLRENLDLRIPSGAVASRDQAVENLRIISSLIASLDDPLVIFGHEPDQWYCENRSQRLANHTERSCLAE